MSKILVETSARHVHLSQEAIDTLFGKGYTLTNKKDLSQPGQFACEEKVEVIGPKGSLKMSILGPARPASQVEISLSDARTLGVKAPVRESGDIAGTPGCTIKVGDNVVEISEGVIVAKRHIHMTPADAAELGVSDKEIVKVKLDTARPLIFDDVVVRVSDKFALAMHIDTDECNAAGAAGEVYGEIVK
ncbi:MAG: phosphate propanoyltransferase [Ruminococcaceae bacterium]|nr:phosphate propanoyltransferase [Oscillospiraceae bacterium]